MHGDALEQLLVGAARVESTQALTFLVGELEPAPLENGGGPGFAVLKLLAESGSPVNRDSSSSFAVAISCLLATNLLPD